MYNEQQDKTGTGSKNSTAKFDYSFVWMICVLNRFRKLIDLGKEFRRMGPRAHKVWSENDLSLFVRFTSLTRFVEYHEYQSVY